MSTIVLSAYKNCGCPPGLSFASITRVVKARWAVVNEAARPAGPAPMMTTSQCRRWLKSRSVPSLLTLKSAIRVLLPPAVRWTRISGRCEELESEKESDRRLCKVSELVEIETIDREIRNF